MKVAASGGPPLTLCEFSGATIVGRGGTWNRDGVILFNNGPGQPLYRVSSAGGPPSPAWKLPDGQAGELFPSFLPDGHHVLFVSNTNDAVNAVFVASLDTGELKHASSARIRAPSMRRQVICSSCARARCWRSRSMRKPLH